MKNIDIKFQRGRINCGYYESFKIKNVKIGDDIVKAVMKDLRTAADYLHYIGKIGLCKKKNCKTNTVATLSA